MAIYQHNELWSIQEQVIDILSFFVLFKELSEFEDLCKNLGQKV